MNGISGEAAWLAAGWTMPHTMWVGGVIGAVAMVAARATRSARPETRHGLALVFLAALAVSPIVIFAWVYTPAPAPVATAQVASPHAPAPLWEPSAAVPIHLQIVIPMAQAGDAAGRDWLGRAVRVLPWIWMIGSGLTVLFLASGLIGVERLRRASRRIAGTDIERRCRELAASLGIARRVSVGVCDRLAGPVLIGVLRPLILLPAAALSGWTLAQLEMVLWHELAHVKRWDNLINLVQRLVESLLFFHPAAWWLSGWIRLERELCCDRLVVGRMGEPLAYAEMLLMMATSRREVRGVASALADRQAATRIRRLLQGGERSMKATLPEGLGLVGAVIAAALLAHGSWASDPPKPAPDRELAQALARAVADLEVQPTAPADRMAKLKAMNTIAEAQRALGDAAGSLTTLRKACDSVVLTEGADFELLEGLFGLAQGQRESGDPAAARATLDRVQKHLGTLKSKAIVDAMKKAGQAPEFKGGDGLMAAMVFGGISFMIAEERLKLGDRAQAVANARDAIKRVQAQTGPRKEAPPGRSDPDASAASFKSQMNAWKTIMLGGLGVIQHQAGDPDWRSTLAAARREAGALTTARERAESLPDLAQFLIETGEGDQAIQALAPLEQAARPAAFRRMLEALADDRPPADAGFDPGGIKITIGASSFTPKDRAATRAALPKIAAAVRAGVGPLQQARLLSMIAHLQAKAGDFAAARATALSIPEVKRSDYPGPADGFYDAVKPVTMGLVAETQSRLDRSAASQAASKALLNQAAALARAVPTPEQKAVALIEIAKAATVCGDQALAGALVGDASAVALGLKEPVRSRALALVACLQVDAGDLAAATQTAAAIRDRPGLEKQRALAPLAQAWRKKGDVAKADEIERQVLAALEAAPPAAAKTAAGSDPKHFSYSSHSYVDFETEVVSWFVEGLRKTAATFLRARVVDQAAALESARKLPPGERDVVLSNLVGQLARDGKPMEALQLAKTLETAAQRLSAIEMTAVAIRDARLVAK